MVRKGNGVSRQSKRQAEARERKLAAVREAVESGRLLIRQAEPGELEPPRNLTKAQGRRESRANFGVIP